MPCKRQFRVIPRSSESKIVEILENGVIKVKLTAPPVDNKANELLISLVSKTLGIRKKDIEIGSGHRSANKTLLFSSLSEAQLNERIQVLS